MDVEFPVTFLNPECWNVSESNNVNSDEKFIFFLLLDVKRAGFHVIESFGKRTLDLYVGIFVDVVVDDQADKVSHHAFRKIANVDVSLENQLFGSGSPFIQSALQNKISCTP